MGDVIGLGRKRPNGKKIVELRNKHGQKQEALAKKVSISVRVLRDIERSNHPVPATTITAIATALQTTPDEITLSTPDGTLIRSASLLKLTAIRSAKDLNDLAHDATQFEYALEVDPTPVTAPAMQSLMVIVRRLVQPWERDEFDLEHFGDIPRLARLQEFLAQLREKGVGVIAGKYIRRSLASTKEDDFSFSEFTPIPGTQWSIKADFILRLHLVPAEKQEDDIPIDPGKSFDRLLEEARRPAMARSDMDDEIPF
jgi:transcriptional regulator with XRE-family HTH domain